MEKECVREREEEAEQDGLREKKKGKLSSITGLGEACNLTK